MITRDDEKEVLLSLLFSNTFYLGTCLKEQKMNGELELLMLVNWSIVNQSNLYLRV